MRICDFCGARLDPEERCDCEREDEKASSEAATSNRAEYNQTVKSVHKINITELLTLFK